MGIAGSSRTDSKPSSQGPHPHGPTSHGQSRNWETRLAETIIRLRVVLLLACLAVAVAAGVGMRFLSFDTDSRIYFDVDNPDRIALDALEATYTRDKNVMIVLAPQDGDVFSRDMLALVAELTEAGWQTPFSRRVDSVTNFQHSYARGDELIIEDLVPDLTALNDAGLQRVEAIALSRVELVNKLVSADGAVTAVNIVCVFPGESLTEVPEAVTHVRRLVEQARQAHPDVDFYVTGVAALDMTFNEAAQNDTQTIVPLMLVMVLVIVGVALRTVTGTLVTLAVIVVSLVTTFGIAGWSGLVLNSATTATPVIIMTLAIANCVHLLASLSTEMRRGLAQREALVEAVRINAQPIAVTSLTTAIGFLSLNFSDSPPLREVGNIVAGGVVVAWLVSMLVLPSVMALVRVSVTRRPAGQVPFTDRLADTVIALRRPLLITTAVVMVIIGVGIHRIVLDDDFVRYFDPRFDFRVATDFTQDTLTGLHILEFSLPAGEDQGIARPDYLAKLDAFAEWYRQQPEVLHVSAISDTIKRLNMNLNQDDPAFHRIPELPAAAAQYLMLYELSVPYGLDLNSQIDIGKSASRVSVTLGEATSAEVRAVAARGEAWLQENAPEMFGRATGDAMAFARISERNIRAMLGGTLLALVLISVVLLFVLRSVKIAVISLAPNLLPALLAFGLWGYFMVEVNLAISVVVAMTLGIVVDDTVHILSKYLRGRREHGYDPFDAVRYAFNTVGTALITTTVALVVGFGVLATSGFAVNGQMGLLSAVTIAVALLADFFFLPPLLLSADRRSAS